MDDAWLDSFPAGSVGAAYRDFVRSENLSAEGLAEVSRQVHGRAEVRHPSAWLGRRTRDVHDIWHILSGYHRDALGEACLVAFSYAQTRSLGWAFIALGAALRPRPNRGHPYARAIWQGYTRGKAAAWLLGEDYETLMFEPLDAARRRLGITPRPSTTPSPPPTATSPRRAERRRSRCPWRLRISPPSPYGEGRRAAPRVGKCDDAPSAGDCHLTSPPALAAQVAPPHKGEGGLCSPTPASAISPSAASPTSRP